MLGDNIKALRKSQGLSQQELAVKLNVVRQTVSKWEQGLSVPDADMLIELAQACHTSVSSLLGEPTSPFEEHDVTVIANKLEVINLQLARKNAQNKRILHLTFIAGALMVVAFSATMLFYQSAYLTWDYSDQETAVLATLAHSGEWIFARIAPFAFLGCILGAYFTRRRT